MNDVILLAMQILKTTLTYEKDYSIILGNNNAI